MRRTSLSQADGWACGSPRRSLRREHDLDLARDLLRDLALQREQVAELLYRVLEEDVVPRFFERGDDSLPHRWIETMKASIESVVPRFSAHRMVRDYVKDAYPPASSRR